VLRREALIDAAARQSKREAFLGPLKDRDRAAHGLVTRGAGAGDADVDAVIEHLRKVPLPFLRLMIERELRIVIVRGSIAEHYKPLKGKRPPGHPPKGTWDRSRTSFHPKELEIVISTGAPGRSSKKLAPPPGALLLREVGRAIDVLLGRDGKPFSLTNKELIEARERDLPKLDPFHGQPGPIGLEETFADLFSRFVRRDKLLRDQLPEIAKAWDRIYDGLIEIEDKRTHPERLRRVTKFLRQWVLANAELSQRARSLLLELTSKESGPWDRGDLDRHVKAVREEPGRVLIETRWGKVAYEIDAPDKEAQRVRSEAFLDKLVRPSARLTANTKQKLEAMAHERYGPWRAIDFADHVRAVVESRGRVMVRGPGGDAPLEG
jgi:hypothetical protein